jgi:hypothetical protein
MQYYVYKKNKDRAVTYYLWLKCPEIEDDGDEDVLISLKLKALFSLVVID